jgi:hypothetical protein
MLRHAGDLRKGGDPFGFNPKDFNLYPSMRHSVVAMNAGDAEAIKDEPGDRYGQKLL